MRGIPCTIDPQGRPEAEDIYARYCTMLVSAARAGRPLSDLRDAQQIAIEKYDRLTYRSMCERRNNDAVFQDAMREARYVANLGKQSTDKGLLQWEPA